MKNKTSPWRSFFIALGTSIFVEITRCLLYPQAYVDWKPIKIVALSLALNLIYHFWNPTDSDFKSALSAFYNQATLPYSVAAILAAIKLFLQGTIPAPPPL